MTRDQLLRSLARNGQQVRLRGSDLPGFDFSGIDLTGADLSFSNLRGANFRTAILHRANLSFAKLNDADFADADLREANLSFSQLDNVNLTGARVQGASFNFSGAGADAPAPPPDALTLTNLLRQPVWGVMLGSLMGALLVYGISGIVYFTNLIATTTDPLIAGLYRFIIVQNVVDGVVSFLIAWGLSGWLARRFSSVWKRHLIVSICVIASFLLINSGLYMTMARTIIDALSRRPGTGSDSGPWYVYVLGDILVANLFLYVLQQGRQLTRKLSDQEVQLLNLEKLKTRAELDALQAKINPHFLYNSLNSIASLVHDDPDRAEEMTLLLSKLFRHSTGRAGELFASLADELDMVRTYLQVEQVRFGSRLSFEIDVANPDLLSLQVPQFLLQPIVENAIKHGISKRADAGRIDIRIYENEGQLSLCVHDNGPDFSTNMNGGYGLRSIQDKLRLLYGDEAAIDFQNTPIKQVVLTLNLARIRQNGPFHTTQPQ
ncbi:hypothetical protein GCM10027578_07740 [Spirosoma luteolum]